MKRMVPRDLSSLHRSCGKQVPFVTRAKGVSLGSCCMPAHSDSSVVEEDPDSTQKHSANCALCCTQSINLCRR